MADRANDGRSIIFVDRGRLWEKITAITIIIIEHTMKLANDTRGNICIFMIFFSFWFLQKIFHEYWFCFLFSLRHHKYRNNDRRK